jgi:hypothetical protein
LWAGQAQSTHVRPTYVFCDIYGAGFKRDSYQTALRFPNRDHLASVYASIKELGLRPVFGINEYDIPLIPEAEDRLALRLSDVYGYNKIEQTLTTRPDSLVTHRSAIYLAEINSDGSLKPILMTE